MTSANYLIPNSYQTPNALVDLIMPLLSDQEWRVLSFAVRHILGFDDFRATRRRRLSVSTFQNGYGRFPGCGLGKQAIIKALDGLAQYGVMRRIGLATNDGQEWELPLDPALIDIKGLKRRSTEKSKRGKRQTDKARAEKANPKRSVKQTTSQDSPAGLSNRPPIKTYAVCQTDHLWSVRQTASGLSNRRNQTHFQTHSQTHIARSYRASAEKAWLMPMPAGYWRMAWAQILLKHVMGQLKAVTEKAEGEREKQRANQAIKDIIQAWIDATQNLDPNVWKNKTIRGYAVSLDANGLSAQDVTDFLVDRYRESFWKGKSISLQVVVRDIGRWKSLRDDDNIDYYDYEAQEASDEDSGDEELSEMPEDIRERLAAMRQNQRVTVR